MFTSMYRENAAERQAKRKGIKYQPSVKKEMRWGYWTQMKAEDALTQWNSGRTRLVLGGYGKSLMLAMDGTEAEGLDAAASSPYHEATDEWASAEYRMDVAAALAKKCLEIAG